MDEWVTDSLAGHLRREIEEEKADITKYVIAGHCDSIEYIRMTARYHALDKVLWHLNELVQAMNDGSSFPSMKGMFD